MVEMYYNRGIFHLDKLLAQKHVCRYLLLFLTFSGKVPTSEATSTYINKKIKQFKLNGPYCYWHDIITVSITKEILSH